MPITDLTGYTWVGNNNLDLSSMSSGVDFYINFISNNIVCDTIHLFYGSKDEYVEYYKRSSGLIVAYSIFSFNGWSDPVYKTIQITGGTDATNPTLIALLQNNGTLTPPAPSGHTLTIDGTNYTIDDNTNLLVNSTGLYNSTTSTQVWTYSGDTKFLGFATSSGGAIVYDINDTITLTSDLTLYSVEQARMPLYINGVQTDKYHGKVVNKIGDYFVARYEYSITTSVTNGTYSGSTSILVNSTATVTITADSGYELPSSVTVTGASYTYNNGVISLSNPTGDVTISVVCEAVVSGITISITNSITGTAQIYDGQSTSGNYLGKVMDNMPPANFTITSGYVYTSVGAFEISGSGAYLGNPVRITEPVELEIVPQMPGGQFL